MTLAKNQMVREVGRRTRLKNRVVQWMLETLIDVWTEELENFIVLETQTIDRGNSVENLPAMKPHASSGA